MSLSSSQLLSCLLCSLWTFKTVRESVLSGTVFVEKGVNFLELAVWLIHQKAHGEDSSVRRRITRDVFLGNQNGKATAPFCSISVNGPKINYW